MLHMMIHPHRTDNPTSGSVCPIQTYMIGDEHGKFKIIDGDPWSSVAIEHVIDKDSDRRYSAGR